MRALWIGVVLMVMVAVAAAGPTAKSKKAKHVPRALVIVIDKSGSMDGAKLEATKRAIFATLEKLDPDDQVGIVVFDSKSTVLVELQRAANRNRISADVEHVEASGGTHILRGLSDAFELLADSELARKHILLISDGAAPSAGLSELMKSMRGARITVSTVAVEGADEKLLQDISTQGGGRAYKVTDLKALAPTFIKETRVALN
jgi:Ca-activated chloride channel family protein